MNSIQLITLIKTGAVVNETEHKIYHSSFRKGWRKLLSNNVSWCAVKRKGLVAFINGTYRAV